MSRGMGRPRRRWRLLAAITVAIAAAWAVGTALAAFPQDPPNDPDYAPAEQGGPATCLPSRRRRAALPLLVHAPVHPGRHRRGGRRGHVGRQGLARLHDRAGHTVIAYIEGGINWRNAAEELANKVFLNAGELPAPDHPGQRRRSLNARDYADTPDSERQRDRRSRGHHRPLLRTASTTTTTATPTTSRAGTSTTTRTTRRPSTRSTTTPTTSMRQAAAQTNNGARRRPGSARSAGCLPIKAGAEALDRTDDLAQAWLYAADMNADVIVSMTADLGYSSFMRQAVDYVWNHGTRSRSSRRTTSTRPTTRAGCSGPTCSRATALVANTHGLDIIPNSAPLQNSETSTYRARSGFTSWGTHNMFSAATQGGTTSESTPTVGGVMALVLSYGKKAAKAGLIAARCRPTRRSRWCAPPPPTSTPTRTRRTAGPASPASTSSTATGAPTSTRRCRRSTTATSRPRPGSTRPDWYSLYDPTHTRKVAVTGHVAAPRASALPLAGAVRARRRARRTASSSAPGADRATPRVQRQARDDRPLEGAEVLLVSGLRVSPATRRCRRTSSTRSRSGFESRTPRAGWESSAGRSPFTTIRRFAAASRSGSAPAARASPCSPISRDAARRRSSSATPTAACTRSTSTARSCRASRC